MGLVAAPDAAGKLDLDHRRVHLAVRVEHHDPLEVDATAAGRRGLRDRLVLGHEVADLRLEVADRRVAGRELRPHARQLPAVHARQRRVPGLLARVDGVDRRVEQVADRHRFARRAGGRRRPLREVVADALLGVRGVERDVGVDDLPDAVLREDLAELGAGLDQLQREARQRLLQVRDGQADRPRQDGAEGRQEQLLRELRLGLLIGELRAQLHDRVSEGGVDHHDPIAGLPPQLVGPDLVDDGVDRADGRRGHAGLGGRLALEQPGDRRVAGGAL